MQKQTFADLGLSQNILTTLDKKGFTHPTPIQAGVIPLFLTGKKDIIGQAQTGTGKTAAFALPLLELIDFEKQEIQAIIMAPTRELAIQVAEEIQSFSQQLQSKIQLIYGGNSMLNEIRGIKTKPPIIVGTPGRIQHHIRTNVLKLGTVKYFVLDEADEMLNFGFRKEIESILSLTSPSRRVLLFSATMPKPILEIAQTYMGDYEKVKIASKEMTNENISQFYFLLKKEEKIEALARIMAPEQNFYAIVFCRTKRETDQVSGQLRSRGFGAEAIHGDIEQKTRQLILGRFKKGETKILVATDVAARGIDVSELNFVINFSLPESFEIYTHRIGRTGRAGNKGTAITFVAYSEMNKLRFFERNLNTTFTKGTLPEGKDIVNKKIAHLAEELEHIANTRDFSDINPVVDILLKTNTAQELIASLLAKFYSKEFNLTSYEQVLGVEESVSLEKNKPQKNFKTKKRTEFKRGGYGKDPQKSSNKKPFQQKKNKNI